MKKVLFICTENRKRSQIAEAIFNHLSKKAGAKSAGLFPGQEVDPLAIEVLNEINIDASTLKPKKVSDEMIKEADLIISFGCFVPPIFSRKEFKEWPIYPPNTIEEFRKVRDEIKEKIEDLIKAENW